MTQDPRILDPLTDAELAALADAAAKATPGTFRAEHNQELEVSRLFIGQHFRALFHSSLRNEADAEFVVQACNAAPRLVAEVRAARSAYLDAARQEPARGAEGTDGE